MHTSAGFLTNLLSKASISLRNLRGLSHTIFLVDRWRKHYIDPHLPVNLVGSSDCTHQNGYHSPCIPLGFTPHYSRMGGGLSFGISTLYVSWPAIQCLDIYINYILYINTSKKCITYNYIFHPLLCRRGSFFCLRPHSHSL